MEKIYDNRKLVVIRGACAETSWHVANKLTWTRRRYSEICLSNVIQIMIIC